MKNRKANVTFFSGKGAVVCLLLLFGFAPLASADEVYTYTGNRLTLPFDPSLEPGETITNLQGSFTLADPLGANLTMGSITPLTFNFTDGHYVWTPDNTTANGVSFGNGGSSFAFATDGAGNISSWSVGLSSVVLGNCYNPCNIIYDYASDSFPGSAEDLTQYEDTMGIDIFSRFFNLDAPGTWTANPTPEPSSLLLLGTGLFGALGVMRRKLLG